MDFLLGTAAGIRPTFEGGNKFHLRVRTTQLNGLQLCAAQEIFPHAS